MSESPAANEAASKNRLTVQAVLRTDVGKVRSENQDFATLTLPEEEHGARLMIVADGMGGHRGGATASRLATETIKEAFLASDSADVAEILRTALSRANARIWAEAQTNVDLRGMGTTTSALVVREGQCWFAHVGDSRIYRVRGEEIEQLTDDHSLVASMVREGLLTAQEAENHPRRNVLQRSMGVGEDVEIDVRGPIELVEGDTFIICSDGLHGVVKEDEMREVARLSVDAAAEEFVRRALEKGAPDNVTVIVAKVVREPGIDTDKTLVETVAPDMFDDTVRDVVKPAPPPPHVERPEEREPVGAGPRPLSIVKWTLIFVILLGAAGGGIFWAQQQAFARQSQSSSR